jgi:hypothetical protein
VPCQSGGCLETARPMRGMRISAGQHEATRPPLTSL